MNSQAGRVLHDARLPDELEGIGDRLRGSEQPAERQITVLILVDAGRRR